MITADEALANAARLLQHAETETNIPLMERLDELACSWLVMASMLTERERV